MNDSVFRLRWFLVMLLSFLLGWLSSIYSTPGSIPLINTSLRTSLDFAEWEETLIRNRLDESEFEWKKAVAKRKGAESDFRALQPNPWAHSHYRSFWDYFYPTFNCPHSTQRIGRLGDGGKWVCGFNHIRKKKKPCIVYSYGVSNETTFEEEIIQLTNCTIFMYDHTVEAKNIQLLQRYPGRANFYKLGLGTQNTDTLSTLRTEMNKHHHDFIDILKIDVEGAEYKCLEHMITEFPNGFPFAQLLMEMHVGSGAGLLGTFRKWWEKLEYAGLRPFQNEVNSYCPLTCFEYSFLNVGVNHYLLHSDDYTDKVI